MNALTDGGPEVARQTRYQHLQPTPQQVWPLRSEALGAELWLKYGTDSPAGTFSMRGGFNCLEAVADKRYVVGLMSAACGNHGQSNPYATDYVDRVVRVPVPVGHLSEEHAPLLTGDDLGPDWFVEALLGPRPKV